MGQISSSPARAPSGDREPFWQVDTPRASEGPTGHATINGTRPDIPPAGTAARVSLLIEVRRLSPYDSLEELTALLHRAYRAQMEMGLRPLAGRQDVATTRRRCASGECYVAVRHGPDCLLRCGSDEGSGSAGVCTCSTAGGSRLIGTILFHEVEDAQGPPWFQRPEVDSFSQFAVDPEYQGCGVGGRLLTIVEQRAVACGAAELGLSMAEPDTALFNYYRRRGYRFIEHWRWPYTNYRSAILSKSLGDIRRAGERVGRDLLWRRGSFSPMPDRVC